MNSSRKDGSGSVKEGSRTLVRRSELERYLDDLDSRADPITDCP